MPITDRGLTVRSVGYSPKKGQIPCCAWGRLEVGPFPYLKSSLTTLGLPLINKDN